MVTGPMVTGLPMKLIGIEEHFLTPEVERAWHAIGLDAIDPSVGYHQGAIGRRLANLADERLALMDETGLDMQVLSLTTPALHDLGPESVELAHRTNDAVAEAVARHPERIQALATLPVAMPDEAALELERCISTLGFKGAILCGRVGTDRLLLSTDYPYQYHAGGEARRFVAECGLDGAGKAAFGSLNWLRLTNDDGAAPTKDLSSQFGKP